MEVRYKRHRNGRTSGAETVSKANKYTELEDILEARLLFGLLTSLATIREHFPKQVRTMKRKIRKKMPKKDA